MTKETREGIAKICYDDDFTAEAGYIAEEYETAPEEVKESYREQAGQILALIREAGYVQLHPDWRWPIPSIDPNSWSLHTPEETYNLAMLDLEKAGWRKVILPPVEPRKEVR